MTPQSPPPSLAAAVPPPAALRAALEQVVIADLLGPAAGSEEEVDETRVSDRYLVGLLAPRKRRVEPEEFDDLGVERAPSPEDGTTDGGTLPAPTLSPSSMGLSFTVAGGTRALRVTLRWGRYERIVSERVVDEAGKPKRTWKRTQVEGLLPAVPLQPGLIGGYDPGFGRWGNSVG
jgi:hypothetical protein